MYAPTLLPSTPAFGRLSAALDFAVHPVSSTRVADSSPGLRVAEALASPEGLTAVRTEGGGGADWWLRWSVPRWMQGPDPARASLPAAPCYLPVGGTSFLRRLDPAAGLVAHGPRPRSETALEIETSVGPWRSVPREPEQRLLEGGTLCHPHPDGLLGFWDYFLMASTVADLGLTRETRDTPATIDPLALNTQINGFYAAVHTWSPKIAWAGAAAFASTHVREVIQLGDVLHDVSFPLRAAARAFDRLTGGNRSARLDLLPRVRALLAQGNRSIFTAFAPAFLAYYEGGAERVRKLHEDVRREIPTSGSEEWDFLNMAPAFEGMETQPERANDWILEVEQGIATSLFFKTPQNAEDILALSPFIVAELDGDADRVDLKTLRSFAVETFRRDPWATLLMGGLNYADPIQRMPFLQGVVSDWNRIRRARPDRVSGRLRDLMRLGGVTLTSVFPENVNAASTAETYNSR